MTRVLLGLFGSRITLRCARGFPRSSTESAARLAIGSAARLGIGSAARLAIGSAARLAIGSAVCPATDGLVATALTHLGRHRDTTGRRATTRRRPVDERAQIDLRPIAVGGMQQRTRQRHHHNAETNEAGSPQGALRSCKARASLTAKPVG